MLAALRLIFATLVLFSIAAPPTRAADNDRGRYLFDAAGCLGCHTDSKNGGQPLAGGRALATPFGTYFSPNITADREHGIGTWTVSQFRRALRHGTAPDGTAYFPVFPYVAYSGMSDTDISDLQAYILSQPPSSRPNTPHDTGILFGNRLLASAWQMLFFTPKTRPERNRGAYLVETLGHCEECHTPRGSFGNLDPDRHLAGTRKGPEGGMIPNITPDPKTGIGNWKDEELKDLFTIGLLPDGDFAGGSMAEVITNTTSKWNADDLSAVIRYLKSQPPINNRVKADKPAGSGTENW